MSILIFRWDLITMKIVKKISQINLSNCPICQFHLFKSQLNQLFKLQSLHLYLLCLSSSQLRNGNILYVSDAGVGGKVERTIGDTVLSDGQWHTLKLLRNGSSTSLQVDGSLSRLIQHPTQDFGGLAVSTLSLGGIPPNPAQQKNTAGEEKMCIF